MARVIDRLTPLTAKNAKPPRGRDAAFIPDGGNLYLQCTRSKDGNVSRSWVFLFEFTGKRHVMGLGPLHDVGLKEAREKARQYRGMLRDKINPLDERRKEHQARLAEAASAITFEEVALDYIAFHEGEWKSDVHRKQGASCGRE
jgi:hypothetical protein